jgi:hypothetical protein
VGHEIVHLSQAEAIRDIASIPERVERCAEAIIEKDQRPAGVTNPTVRPPPWMQTSPRTWKRSSAGGSRRTSRDGTDPKATGSYKIIYSATITAGGQSSARASMASDLTHEKRQLHELVDRLAPSHVHAVHGLLQAMLDPVSQATANAPVDDEPLTAEEARSLDEAREWLKHNKPIPHEQVLAELGITQQEVEDYQEPA